MKKILLTILCLALMNCALAESAADAFLNNLSKTWDSFLDMAEEAGDKAADDFADWVESAGEDFAEWAESAGQDFSLWADGFSSWAAGAADDLAAWLKENDLGEWADLTARDIQSFLAENRDKLKAWYDGADESVKSALKVLTEPNRHSSEEIKQAAKTVIDSLKDAGIRLPRGK